MSFHPHLILTPGASRKRKERDASYTVKKPAPVPVSAFKDEESNRLLAGYMACEFLTKGTLLGQKFDPARAVALPVASSSAESKRVNPETEPSNVKEEQESYAEVASILKTDGAHLPGIVNPTQLARWIQM